MLEVIGAGCGRTGTLSLKAALERLGFGPCHHMLGLLERPDEIGLWRKDDRDWDALYAGYRSTVDWPGARFWKELADHFPEAKVVLTVRDPQHWYESALGTIHRAAMDTSPADAVLEELRQMSREVVWDGVFDGRFTDIEYAKKVFVEHNETVRSEVEAGRLLVFEIAQGWEPLCEFLGVPVPNEPFPRRNDQEQFASLLRDRTTPA